MSLLRTLILGPEERYAPPVASVVDSPEPAGEILSSVDIYGAGYAPGTVIHADVRGLTAYACAVRVLSTTLASLDWEVIRRSDGIHARDHVAWRLLNEDMRTGVRQNAHRWRVEAVRELMYHGNSVARVVRDGVTGNLQGVEWLDWRHVGVQNVGQRTYYHYYRPGTGRPEVYADFEVIHFRGVDTDAETGLGISPILQFSRTFGEIRDTQRLAARFAEKGGFLRGVIEMMEKLKPGFGERIASAWRRTYLSAENTNGVAVLENGAKYRELTSSLRDAQHVETRQFQIAEASRITGVPPHLLHSLERATFNNIYELSISFVRYTLMPLARSMGAEVHAKLFTPRERAIYRAPEHDFSKLLQAAPSERGEYLRAMVTGGVMTPNEARAVEELQPEPGGDALYMQSNMLPVSKLGVALSADVTDDQPTGDPAEGGEDEPGGPADD